MQGLSRWRGLVNSKSEKDQSQSQSRTKKYTPSRNQTTSELNKKLKIINTSKINQSSAQIQNFVSKDQNSLKISLIKVAQSSEGIKSPTRKLETGKLNIKTHLKNTEEQISSPTISIKLMNRLKRAEHPNGINISKGLFSLDDQHRYIHKQLTEMKIQFAKLKQIVMNQLKKQKKQIQQITQKIYWRLEQVIQIYSRNLEDSPQFLTKDVNYMKGINIEGFVFNNQNLKESIIPEISIIRQKSDLTQSKLQLKKMFGEESQKIDQALMSNKITDSPIKIRSRYQNARSDRVFTQKSQIKGQQIDLRNQINEFKFESRKSRVQNTSTIKSKSKKQFEKLFEAVKSLKNEIKGFKGITNLTCPIVTSYNEIKVKQNKQQQKYYDGIKNN